MSKKLQAIQMSTGGEKSQLLQSLEYLKLSCRMFQKFGFGSDELDLAVKHFNLGENKELVSFTNLARAQK
jgi:hypothetical protein